MKKGVINLLKGVAIGSSMLVPGVSGGTMAIVLGVYDKIVHAVSSFLKNKKENALLLLQIGLGGVIGAWLLAGCLSGVVAAYRKPMMFLFLGAILGSIPSLVKKTGIKKLKPLHIVYFLAGLSIVLILSFLPERLFQFSKMGALSFFILMFAGTVIAVALVLPGISASYMLVMLGIYDTVLYAIVHFNFLFLVPLAIGTIFGVLLTTGLLERAMDQHTGATYLMIIGFVAGSLLEVFPGIPVGIEILVCAVTLLIGFFIIFFLSGLKG